MVRQSIPLIDRLQERGLIDRWGFTVFAAAGSIAILAAKFFTLPTAIVALGAIGVMLLYAILVNMRGTGKLRSDQAGDNCYYLGLIFTLTSLSYAIFTFDPEKTATTIVQGFGIALASTIAGLVLRVFFSQSRVDLFEVEDTARLELAEAAGKLKAELSQIALEFTHFAVGLQQSVGEVRDEAAESVNKTAEQAMSAVRQVAAEAVSALANHGDELAGHAADLSKKTASVARSIDRYTTSIDEISDGHKTIVADVKRTALLAKDMTAYSAQLVEDSRIINVFQQSSHSLFTDVGDVTSKTMASVQSSLNVIRAFEDNFSARLQELENGPKLVVDKALHAIAAAAQSVERAMAHLAATQEHSTSEATNAANNALLAVTRAQEEAIETTTATADAALRQLSTAQSAAVNSLSTSSEEALGILRAHNVELAKELALVRDHARQVHQVAATANPMTIRPVS